MFQHCVYIIWKLIIIDCGFQYSLPPERSQVNILTELPAIVQSIAISYICICIMSGGSLLSVFLYPLSKKFKGARKGLGGTKPLCFPQTCLL